MGEDFTVVLTGIAIAALIGVLAALVPRIRDQDRLKNPDTTQTDLEYETSQARVFSDYGTPAIIIAGSGIEVVGLTVMQRMNYKLKEENRPQDQLRGQIQQVAIGRFRIMKTEPQCDATAFASSRSEPSPPAAISRPADDAASRSRTDEGEPRHEETHIFNVRASWARAGTHSLSERNLTSQAFADLLADLPCPDSPVRPHTDFFP